MRFTAGPRTRPFRADLTTSYEFRARPGFHVSDTDAQVIGVRLVELGHDQEPLTAERVVEDARSVDSPLHRFFEWDDAKAAEMHRLDQARLLIRSVNIVLSGGGVEIETRGFHFVDVNGEKDVVDAPTLFERQDLVDQVLRKAAAELRSWRETYHRFERFQTVIELVDLAIARLPKE